MLLRDLSHSRCVHRCCCLSWSCEPHLADCEIVASRELFTVARGGGSFVEETAAELLPRRGRPRRGAA
jgi:hypothetical protein